MLKLDNVYVPQLTPLEKRHLEICKISDPVITDIDSIPDNWYKVLFALEPDKMDDLVEYVKAHDFSGVDFVRSAPEYYEILPQNISKGSALKMMREVCNMQDYTFVAVGDYNNDLEMIMEADVGICPSNASDEVKSSADIILEESCEEDVIARVIDIIFDRCQAKNGG